jgi:hypothetical protein
MEHPAGEAGGGALWVDFDRRLKLEFHHSRITSDAGILVHRELEDTLGLTDLTSAVLSERRRGKNIRHLLTGLLRQSVFGRLAGYEDVNDADRLAHDPAMRAVVDRGGLDRCAALLNGGSRKSRNGTDIYEADALRDANREWLRDIDHAVQCPDGNCGLTLLSGQAASAQRRSDQMFVTADCRFHQVASAVAGCFLPAHATLRRDHSDVPVALALPVGAVCAQHCRCARRNHHVWRRIMLLTRHGLVNRLAIISAIRDEASDLAVDLLEQSKCPSEDFPNHLSRLPAVARGA